MARGLGLTDFLVSCSDLLLHWGDWRACAWEGRGDLLSAAAGLRALDSQKMEQTPVLAQTPDVKL